MNSFCPPHGERAGQYRALMLNVPLSICDLFSARFAAAVPKNSFTAAGVVALLGKGGTTTLFAEAETVRTMS